MEEGASQSTTQSTASLSKNTGLHRQGTVDCQDPLWQAPVEYEGLMGVCKACCCMLHYYPILSAWFIRKAGPINLIRCSGTPTPLHRRTWPINTLPGNPEKVEGHLPWRSLPVSAARTQTYLQCRINTLSHPSPADTRQIKPVQLRDMKSISNEGFRVRISNAVVLLCLPLL